MKGIETILASVLALFLVFTVLGREDRSVPGYPQGSRRPATGIDLTRAPDLKGRSPSEITQLVDKVTEELASERKAAVVAKSVAAKPKGEAARPGTAHKEEKSSRKPLGDVGILFGPHAFPDPFGPGAITLAELERQKRDRCEREFPGTNYWSCNPKPFYEREGEEARYQCIDCNDVRVIAPMDQLGAALWEPDRPVQGRFVRYGLSYVE